VDGQTYPSDRSPQEIRLAQLRLLPPTALKTCYDTLYLQYIRMLVMADPGPRLQIFFKYHLSLLLEYNDRRAQLCEMPNATKGSLRKDLREIGVQITNIL
jgi:hypothetical protein